MFYTSILKRFCLENNLEFPNFEVNEMFNSQFICSVYWYREHIHTSRIYNDKEKTILECLFYISDWVYKEYNFIKILKLEENKNMITQ
jgi:hypothetical protein